MTPWTIQSVEFSRPAYWSVYPFHSPGDLPNPGIEPMSPILQVDSLPTGPPGKPKNTGVGSLSLLQLIFPTQESNWGPLHYRRILYQLSYQGCACVRQATKGQDLGLASCPPPAQGVWVHPSSFFRYPAFYSFPHSMSFQPFSFGSSFESAQTPQATALDMNFESYWFYDQSRSLFH